MIADIKFVCSHCGQKIAVGSDAAGLSVECPTCQNSVTIPEPVSRIAPRRKDGGVREKSAGAPGQTEIKALQNERLSLRGEVASLKQRAAMAEARLGAMQGEFDLQRQRLEATGTQLAATGQALSEARGSAAQSIGERSAAEQEIAGIRSELAATLAAFEQSQSAAAIASARLAEAERQLAESREKIAAAESEARSLEKEKTSAQADLAALQNLLEEDEISREFLSTKTRLGSVERELHAHREATAKLEAELAVVESERRRLDDERTAMHRRVAVALREAESLSQDRLNTDNGKLREMLDRQNEELKNLYRDLTRFRRAKLTLKIIWALTALGMTCLGYAFLKVLPMIEWAQ